MKRKKLTQMPGDKLAVIAPEVFKARKIEFVTQNAAQLWLDNTKGAAIRYILEYSQSEWLDEIVDSVIERVNEWSGIKKNDRYGRGE